MDSLPPIRRLNYIGSKYQLLSWLRDTILEETQWSSLNQKRIGDLFAGTGIVSLFFANEGAILTSNDAERYSSIITNALLRSSYSSTLQDIIQQLNQAIKEIEHLDADFITKQYSPFEECKRQFFTVENAKRIDFIRTQISIYQTQCQLTEGEVQFLLASLIVSADRVSNVPAVYGCFLKKFKAKSLQAFELLPIHRMENQTSSHCVFSMDILEAIAQMNPVDMVYLDPPYNERNYSANYFPLNAICQSPIETNRYSSLTGVTGVLPDCFRSDFCKKTKVKQTFGLLFKALKEKTKWIFLSYNSEGLLSKEQLEECIRKELPSSKVRVIERDYKRFKNFDYTEKETDNNVIEYLFSIQN